jgi:hypothetical protein
MIPLCFPPSEKELYNSLYLTYLMGNLPRPSLKPFTLDMINYLSLMSHSKTILILTRIYLMSIGNEKITRNLLNIEFFIIINEKKYIFVSNSFLFSL